MISIRDYETTSIAYENHLLDENHENSNDPNFKFDTAELVAGQTINPFTAVPNSMIADRPGLAKRCDTTLVNVLVIEYLDLRFICNLLLEIWDFTVL